MNKKKVLHLFPAYKLGGVPINVYTLINASQKEVESYTIAHKVDSDLYKKFTKTSAIVFDQNLSVFSIKTLIKIGILFFKIKPDIVHCHGKGGVLYGFFLKNIFFLTGFSMFYKFAGFNLKYKGLKKQLYLKFEKLLSFYYVKAIAVSNSEKNFFLSKVRVSKNKVVVIPNGVAIKKADITNVEITKTIRRYDYNVVSLSRISHQKDIITMIEVMEKLNNKKVALHIMGGYMDGDIEYKNEVMSRLQQSKVKDTIYFWGDISNASSYLHQFDVYLTTALFEGLPTAVIEAGLSGIPIIGTDCVGNIDLIKDKKTGFLCKVKDSENISKTLAFVLTNLKSEEIQNIKETCLEMMKEYSIENYCSNILKLYGVER